MTGAVASLPGRAARQGGQAGEFLWVGGATFILFPLCWLARAALGLDTAELAVGFLTFHAAHLINDPHFSVTYVLFYRDLKRRALGDAFGRVERVRYWIAGFVVPALLALWAAWALSSGSATLLGLLVQLMFLLVGWHYVKQAFGVLSVLSARRGVRFSQKERWLVLAHCYAAWAYAWASPADPGKTVSEKGVVYTSLTHPAGLEPLTQILFLLSAIGVAWALLSKWRREQRLPPIGPLAAFMASVWLWTVYSSLDPLMVYLIPALHSVQYLYFVWLLKRNEARAEEGPPAFGRPTALRLSMLAASALGLGWLLFHGAPSLVDAAAQPDGGLGPTPFFAASFAFVNIHHYFMDHVIWRRDNPETRYLRADAPAES